jgi:MinD-like ATPase involved in chromosome partitioning or flagellar assembly
LKIITICGADSKVGASMLTQCLAETLAERHGDKKIITVSADIAGGEYYETFAGKSLASLKAAIISGVLKSSDIMENSFPHARHKNLFMLRGPDSYAARSSFFPEHAKLLADAAAEEFDLLVADIGVNMQTGLAIGLLKESDLSVLVTTQQAHALRRYNYRKQELLDALGATFPYLAVNKHAPLRGLDDMSAMKEKYGAEDGCAIPYSEFCWQAEKESESLIGFKNRAFAKGMRAFADDAERYLLLPAGQGGRRKTQGSAQVSARKDEDEKRPGGGLLTSRRRLGTGR